MYLIKSTFRIDIPSKSTKMKLFDVFVQSLPYFFSCVIPLLVFFFTLDGLLTSIISVLGLKIMFLLEVYPHYNNAKLILDEKEMIVNNRFYSNSLKYSDISTVSFLIVDSKPF